MRALRVIFAGGGTGGHLYPALAIAEGLRKKLLPRECQISLVGSRRGIEYRKRHELGFPLELIPVRGFRRSLSWKNLLFPFSLIAAMIKSNNLLSRLKPDLVVGTGGYVSGPVVSRALARGITCAIQEQNSYPGFTTRKLAGKVKRVYLGFADAKKHLPDNSCTLLTGNPVRSDIGTVDRGEALKIFGLNEHKKTIVILGGSQGARSINNAVLAGLKDLPEDVQLLWQTGEGERERVQAELPKISAGCDNLSERVCLLGFTTKMAAVYAAADIIIARAGALTIAEILASGAPSILVPYPFAAADHQTNNARSIEKNGAALVLIDADLSKDSKTGGVLQLATQALADGRAKSMRDNIASANQGADKSAVEMIVTDLLELLKEQGTLS